MADHIGVQTIPDCKMIRSPEADCPGISPYLKNVHKELVQLHRNRKILGIVPIVFEGKEYYLIGMMGKGNTVTPTNVANIHWAPFARLLTLEEWKEVLRDSGARLRYCTPIKCELYDPYKAVEVLSTTPVMRACTLAARWGDKDVDLLAAYTGTIIDNNVEAYLPFAMIISEQEAAKLWTQGKRDSNAIAGERFLKDRSQGPAMHPWEGEPAKQAAPEAQLESVPGAEKMKSTHKLLKNKPKFSDFKTPPKPIKPPDKKSKGGIILP